MISQKSNSFGLWNFVLGDFFINIIIFQYVKGVHPKHKIQNTLVKSCCSHILRYQYFLLYKDFWLCYLIPFLEMKKMGNS
jgi:hypothetical protein